MSECRTGYDCSLWIYKMKHTAIDRRSVARFLLWNDV